MVRNILCYLQVCRVGERWFGSFFCILQLCLFGALDIYVLHKLWVGEKRRSGLAYFCIPFMSGFRSCRAWCANAPMIEPNETKYQIHLSRSRLRDLIPWRSDNSNVDNHIS